ncbi:hypothetical protein RB597_009478 [Gaeumannomyces tritici]
MPSEDRREKQAAAQSAVDILHEISTILVRLFVTPIPFSAAAHPHQRFVPHNCKDDGGLLTPSLPLHKTKQNCHLDRRTLSVCVSMIENGVSPEALAAVVKELRKQGQEAAAAQIAASATARRK